MSKSLAMFGHDAHLAQRMHYAGPAMGRRSARLTEPRLGCSSGRRWGIALSGQLRLSLLSGPWSRLHRVGEGEPVTAGLGLESGWQAGRIAELAENEAAAAEAPGASDDECQGQRLARQVPGTGPDGLAEQKHR